MGRARVFVAALAIASIHRAGAFNSHQCLATVNNMTVDGKTDNHGRLLPPSTSNATAITYDLCVSQCGADQEPFQWPIFSQQFSSWQLPYLALVSQLPFGANDKLDNLESMLLTVGSPTLAAYSLALTVLNGRWIAKLFADYRYPNVNNAVRILSNLQQSPVRVDRTNALLGSLVLLPQNDEWWAEMVVWLDYTHTWSISAVASIAWVIIAYVFTIVDYFSQGAQNVLNANGQGVGSIGSLWLWLLPIVTGWLQLSPKCDSIRINQAMERVNAIAYVATETSPVKANSVTRKRGISIKLSEVDEVRSDECSTPPIYNYARFLPWVRAVLTVSDTFGIISERDHHNHNPVFPSTAWRNRNPDDGSQLTAEEVEEYCLPEPESVFYQPRRRWGLDDSVVSRMFIASVIALMLQWGTTGAAVIIVWFTPTIGLGCRSLSYIIYGSLSTLVWMMLLASSILTYYYSTSTPVRLSRGQFIFPIQARAACWFSILFRRLGKLIAVFNAAWIVATGLLQFGSVFDRCYCNSSVLGLGKRAYDVIVLTQDDMGGVRAAWIGGFILAAGVVAFFSGFVSLFIDPALPP